MKKQQYKYQAFISYRHADNKEQGRTWATWLHQAIETYEVPLDLVGKTNNQGVEIPARIYPIFRDEEELPTDANLGSAIINALDKTQLLILLCSPRSVQSTYVADEIDYFKKMGHSDKIIAVMIDGEPNASWDRGKQKAGFNEGDECFPVPLQFEYDDNGNRTTKHTEPLAADFRINNNGKPEQGWTSIEAYRQYLKSTTDFTSKIIQVKLDSYQKQQQLMLLKIIAGILGVPLGELTQRDKAYQLEKAQQKAKVLKRWLSAVFVLALLAIGASIFAYYKQKEAVIQKQIVEKTLNGVRKNISFMNVDLQEILKEHVPLNKRYKVTKHIDELLNQLQTGESESEEDQYAVFLALINKIEVLNQNTENNVAKSLPIAAKAKAIISNLHIIHPTNINYQSGLNNIYKQLVETQFLSGNLDKSYEISQAALKIAIAIAEKSPNNDDFKLQLVFAYNNIGDVSNELEKFDKSLLAYKKSKIISSDLIKRNPDNIKYQISLGEVYISMGYNYIHVDKMLAYEQFSQALEIAKSLIESHPKNESVIILIGEVYNNFANYYSLKNEPDNALINVKRSLEYYNYLVVKDPTNTVYQNNIVLINLQLGDNYSDLKQYEVALDSYKKALKMDSDLANKYPENVNFQKSLGLDYFIVGLTHVRLNQLNEALINYKAYLNAFKELTQKYPDKSDFYYRLSGAQARIAKVYAQLGNPQKAMDSYKEAIKIDSMLIEKYPTNTAYKADLARIYKKLYLFFKDTSQLDKALDSIRKSRDILSKLDIESMYPEDKEALILANKIITDFNND